MHTRPGKNANETNVTYRLILGTQGKRHKMTMKKGRKKKT